MKTLSDTFFTRMFVLAGIWNAGIGLTGLFFTGFSVSLFFGQREVFSDYAGLLMFRLFMVAVLIFGAGYYIVSRELMLNRGIICLGLASKVILFITFILLFIKGETTLIAALAVTGDFLWSLLFILFLNRTRSRIKISCIIG